MVVHIVNYFFLLEFEFRHLLTKWEGHTGKYLTRGHRLKFDTLYECGIWESEKENVRKCKKKGTWFTSIDGGNTLYWRQKVLQTYTYSFCPIKFDIIIYRTNSDNQNFRARSLYKCFLSTPLLLLLLLQHCTKTTTEKKKTCLSSGVYVKFKTYRSPASGLMNIKRKHENYNDWKVRKNDEVR